MVHSGTMSEADYKLLKFADTVDDAFAQVRHQMEKHHLALDAD